LTLPRSVPPSSFKFVVLSPSPSIFMVVSVMVVFSVTFTEEVNPLTERYAAEFGPDFSIVPGANIWLTFNGLKPPPSGAWYCTDPVTDRTVAEASLEAPAATKRVVKPVTASVKPHIKINLIRFITILD